MTPHQPNAVPPPLGAAPRFSPEAMAQRSGGGITKFIGIVLLILALLCVVNGIASVASGLMGGGVPPMNAGNVPPEVQREIDRYTQEMIDRALGRWTFWANGSLELLLALLSTLAGVALLRGKVAGIKWTLLRCAVAVFLFIPVYGYEGFTQMSEIGGLMRAITAQVQSDIDRAETRRAPPPTPSNAPANSSTAGATSQPVPPPRPRSRQSEELGQTMEKFMRGVGYGTVVLFSFFIVIVNGLMALLVSRPKVREYLEHSQEGGDALPHFDAAMGLPLGPGPAVAPAGPPPMGPGAPIVAMAPPEASRFKHLGSSTRESNDKPDTQN